ncbi:MAG: hypothetical protein B6D41_20615 [Chloroflexi bacterium UTCFX4]|jgi:hypothetical protein|nr:MAG: hypothetical protein B6D41_20615 [Chloroflexi bacterium UTCFX4]
MAKPIAVLHYAFVDESGALADPNDAFIIVAGIVTHAPSGLEKVVRKIRERLKRKGKPYRNLGELKFSRASDAARKQTLAAIAQRQDIEIFLLALEKNRQVIQDTPTRYAAILWQLMSVILARHPNTRFVLDRRYTRAELRSRMENEINQRAGRGISITHVGSEQDARIQLADFVAGAAAAKYQSGDSTFWEIVAPRVVREQRSVWQEK